MAALSGVAGVTGSAAVRRDPGRITSCPRLVLQAILYLLFPVDAAWSPSFWGGAQYGGWRRRAKVLWVRIRRQNEHRSTCDPLTTPCTWTRISACYLFCGKCTCSGGAVLCSAPYSAAEWAKEQSKCIHTAGVMPVFPPDRLTRPACPGTKSVGGVCRCHKAQPEAPPMIARVIRVLWVRIRRQNEHRSTCDPVTTPCTWTRISACYLFCGKCTCSGGAGLCDTPHSAAE